MRHLLREYPDVASVAGLVNSKRGGEKTNKNHRQNPLDLGKVNSKKATSWGRKEKTHPHFPTQRKNSVLTYWCVQVVDRKSSRTGPETYFGGLMKGEGKKPTRT